MKSINQFIKSKRTLRSTFVIIFSAMLLLPVIIYGSIQSSVIAASTGQNIADKAKALAWGEGEDSESSPTTAFSEAAKSAGLDPNDDCLRFVQTVILSSGVDPSFPKGEYSHNGGVDEYQTVKYMNDSNKWKKIDTTNKASLQPGDILVSAVDGVGNNHIFIYLGNDKVAAANFEDHYGRIGNLSEEWDPNDGNDKPFYYGDNKYQVFRLDSADDTSSSENTPYYSTIKTTTDGLTKEQLNKFSQNNILFYDPGECEKNGGSGTLCGDNAKAKYWAALSKYYSDPIQLAGIIGNLHGEGDFNPVSWQCYNGVGEDGQFVSGDWDYYYNLNSDVGVGAFGITSGLNTYLHYINDNAPELIKYFSNPSEYSFNYCYHESSYDYNEDTHTYGDELLEKIGSTDFDKLVEMEVKYAIEEFKPSVSDHYRNTNWSTPTAASNYWAEFWEVCGGNNGHECLDPYESSPAKQERARYAEKTYDDFQNYSCDPNSTSDVTLIGDSISLMSRKNLEEKFPNGFLSVESSRHPTSPGDCHDQGGLEVLRTIASGSGAVSTQNYPAMECSKLTVDESSLKNNVVWALGTNTTGANKGTVDEVIKLVGPNRNLFLVTPYNRNSNLKTDTEKIAQIYRDAASENSNVYVVDWANAIKSNDSKYLNSDGYHPNSEGTKLFASLISNAVSSSGSSSNSGISSSNSSSLSPSDSVSGSDITWIGDSDSALASDENGDSLIEKTFPGVDYGPSFNSQSSYIQSCKEVNANGCGDVQPNRSGLDILEQIIKEGKLRKYLVFALGGNGGWTQEAMNKLIELVGDDTQVVLTTTKYRSDTDYTADNEIVKKAAAEHSNIHVADIAANYKDEYFSDSDIEFNSAGAKMFVQTIKDVLDTLSGNGCTTYEGDYPEYDQCDPRWGGDDYGGGGRTICNSACGAASMAMLATVATGQDIFPNDIAKLLGSHYYDKESVHTLDPIVGEHYGFEVIKDTSSTLEETKTKFRDYLQKGYMIHFTGAGCHPGFQANGDCSKGHVIGLYSIDANDNVMQANSGWGLNQKSSLDEVAQAKTWDEFTAVRGGSGGKNTCNNNFCKKDTGSSSGGLTKEQAEKVAHYYNTQHTPRGCCGLKNCVEFSNFFVSELTTKGTPGGYSVEGDGNQVVHYLVQNGQAEGGTEPKVWAVFSKTDGQHTGVIVGANSDGTYITVEAAYPGWKDGYMDGNGNGRVYADKTFTDGTYEFAYFASNLNNSKLNEILK